MEFKIILIGELLVILDSFIDLLAVILLINVIIKYIIIQRVKAELLIIVIDVTQVIIKRKRVINQEGAPSFNISQVIQRVNSIIIVKGMLNIIKDPIINDCPLPPLNFRNIDQL